MQPYHSLRRRRSLTSTLVSASVLILLMVFHPAPAQASQPSSELEVPSVSSSSSSIPSDDAAAEGFECRGFPPKCGYLLGKSATKTVMTAAAAGGIAAAVVACNALPGVSQVACAVIGAVSGVALADLVSGYTEGTCLFLAVPLELVDC